MWDHNPVRMSLVHMLPGIAEQRGISLAPLLNRAGLPEGETFAGSGIVARAQISTLLNHLARHAGEPAIGLDLAASVDPAQLGMVGSALFSGRTLRECIVALARHMPSLQGGVAFHLDERDGTARWRHSMTDSDPEHAKVLNEGIMAFVAQALTLITGMDGAQFCIGLPHRAQAPLRLYEEKLGARLTFGASDGIEFSFDAAWLDQPNRRFITMPPEVVALPGGLLFAGGSEAVWRDDASVVDAMSRLFESSALSGSLGLIDTARSLGISPRGLQRRLARLGTSYEERVDVWRHRQARRYLADGALPVGLIAGALGYKHAAHFVRAFRRWEGRTPLAFRHLAAAGG